MAQSSSSLRVAPPSHEARPVHASKVERGPGLRKTEPPSSASPTEQDELDDRPTQRRIAIGAHDHRPSVTGTIRLASGALHVFGPDATWLGEYPNLVVAQQRLDQFFGRRPRKASR